jgi:hypothetical protein
MRAKTIAIAAAALLAVVITGPVTAADLNAAGVWQAVDEHTHQPTGWFVIRDNGTGVFTGVIAKMFLRPGEDPNVTCTKCKDDRRDHPWLGLEIIRGMQRNGMKYENGSILDPRDGNVYNAMMTLSPDGQMLTVRGYLGISLLGRNEYWTRLPDSAYSQIDPSLNPYRPNGTSMRNQPGGPAMAPVRNSFQR